MLRYDTMIRILLLLLCIGFGAYPLRVHAQIRDFSCYNSCMRQPGAMPYDCNQQCRVKKQELERIYGVPEEEKQEKPPVNRVCFDRCISQVGDDAVCREECQEGVKRKKKEKKAEHEGCLAECRKSDLSEAGCLRECAGQGNMSDFRDRFNEPEEQEEDENDFSAMNFSCFKQCRKSGEGFDDCRELCAE